MKTNSKCSLYFLLIVTALFVLKSGAFAADRTWDGSSSSAWNTPANWDCNCFPSTADNVIIDAGSYANAPIISVNPTNSVKDLTIRNNGLLTITGGTSSFTKNLIITTGGDLTITGGTVSITANSTIDGVGSTLNISGTLAGTVFNMNAKLTIGGTTAGPVVNFSGGTFNYGGNLLLDGAGTVFNMSDASGTKALTLLDANTTSKIIIGSTAGGAIFNFSGGSIILDHNLEINSAGSQFNMSDATGTALGTSLTETSTSKIKMGATSGGALFAFSGGNITMDDDFEIDNTGTVFRMTGTQASTIFNLNTGVAGTQPFNLGTTTAGGALFDFQGGLINLNSTLTVDRTGTEFRMSGTPATTRLNITNTYGILVGTTAAGALFNFSGGDIDITADLAINQAGSTFTMSGTAANTTLDIAATATNGLTVSTTTADAIFNLWGGTLTLAGDNVILDKGGQFVMSSGSPVLNIPAAGKIQIKNTASGSSSTTFDMSTGTVNNAGALEIGNASDQASKTNRCIISGGTFTVSGTTSFLGTNATDIPQLDISGGSVTLTGAVDATSACMNFDVSGSAAVTFGNALTMDGSTSPYDRLDQSGTSTITFNGTFAWTISNGGVYSATGGTAIFGTNATTTTLTQAGSATWQFFSVQINNGKTLAQGTATALSVAGNWDNNNGGSFTEVAGTITFNGSANNQTIDPPAGGETFSHLTINNTFSGGIVTSTGDIYITNARTLTISSGILDMSTFTLDDASGSANLTMTGGGLYLAKAGVTVPELGGTYTMSTTAGTVKFYANGNQTIRCATVSSPAVANYFDVIFAGTGGTKTLQGNIVVRGSLYIQGTTQLDVSGSNRQINVGGSWSNTSTHATDPFVQQSGTVVFDQAGDVTVACSFAGGETFYNLTIGKSAATEDVTLSNDLKITNQLTLTTGHINTSSSAYLILDVSAPAVASTSNNSHIVGPMKKNTNTTTAFTFPIGKGGNYRWIKVTPTSVAATTYTAEYFYTTPASNTSVGAGVDHVSDVEYWNLDRSGAANADVELSWTTNSYLNIGVYDAADLLITQWDGATQWVTRGGTVQGGSTSSTGSISVSGLSTFNNPLTLGSSTTDNELGNARYSIAAGGNWNSTATWSNRSGGTGGKSVPTSSTIMVTIERGATVTVDVATAQCIGLTLGTANGAGTLAFSNTTNDIAVTTGGIIVASNGDIESANNGNLVSSTGGLTVNADISVQGGGGASDYILQLLTTAGQSISGTGTIPNLTLSATTTNTGAITVSDVFTVSSTCTNNGTFTIGGTIAGGNNNLVNGATGTINITTTTNLANTINCGTAGNTVTVNNAAAMNISSIATTFHHLNIQGTLAKNSTAATNTINGDLTISSTGILDGTSRTWNILGNWVNNNTTAGAGFVQGTSTVSFNGTSAQSISSSSNFTETFTNLTINNSSSTGVTFSTPVIVTTALTLTDGLVYTTGTNLLTLNDNITCTCTGSSTVYVDGPIKKIGDDAFVFPLGNSGKYARLGISDPGANAAQEYTAQYIRTGYGAYTVTSPITDVSHSEYWTLSQSGATDDVRVTLYWEDAAASAIDNCADLTVAHYDGTSTWVNEAATTSGSCIGTASGSVTTNAVVSTYSPFTFGSQSSVLNPLPIQLIYFDAVEDNRKVNVKWITASEINNDYFTVERSFDGVDFEVLTTVDGAGNSSQQRNYSTFDHYPLKGVSYYRLKQTDFDGKYTYSNIVSVEFNANGTFFTVYPNPTELGEKPHIRFNVSEAKDILVVVNDVNGKEVFSKVTIVEKGDDQVVAIDPSNTLPAGVYIISASSDNSIYRQKLIIR
ncbi:MAG: T9SS type A sorting domain-containing protein [Bacteroidia bacterium]|nr:T9SS type A sorting domain-containing protein [Bacteroidia bacterium]